MNRKGIHSLRDMFGDGDVGARLPDGRHVIAVAEPFSGNYFRAAWEVLRGRAIAIEWPEAGDLERIIYRRRHEVQP